MLFLPRLIPKTTEELIRDVDEEAELAKLEKEVQQKVMNALVSSFVLPCKLVIRMLVPSHDHIFPNRVVYLSNVRCSLCMQCACLREGSWRTHWPIHWCTWQLYVCVVEHPKCMLEAMET